MNGPLTIQLTDIAGNSVDGGIELRRRDGQPFDAFNDEAGADVISLPYATSGGVFTAWLPTGPYDWRATVGSDTVDWRPVDVPATIGPPGPQGDPGEKGDIGPAGPAGADGAQGPEGAQGPVGSDGPIGPQGEIGPAGAEGPIGPAGAEGPIGPAGAEGPIGPAGADGATGPQGEVGPIGPTGADGPIGPQGEVGPAGVQGPAGTDGATGPKGETGDAGPIGPVGADGPAGPKGDAGDAGPKGETGDTGPAGVKGDTGAAGPTGATGPQGIPGDTGATGPQGPEGPQGPTATVPIEAWHTAGDVGEPALQNGWQHAFGNFKVQFRKRPDGVVELRGFASPGLVGTAIFTLPVGYRPVGQDKMVFSTISRAGTDEDPDSVGVTTAGVVTHEGTTVGTSGLSLSTVRFSTDQADFPTGPAGPQGVPGDPGGPPGPTGPAGPQGETGYDTSPIGGVLSFSGDTIPEDWVLADGRELVQLDYPAAYAVMGAKYGAAAAGKFKVPDLRDRFIYGKNAGALGAVGGAATVILAPNQMPVHTHGPSEPGTGFVVGDPTPDYFDAPVASGPGTQPRSQKATTNAAGGGLPHENMPPYLVLAHIVKVQGVSISSGAIVGPAGPVGPQGSTGDAGPIGPQGVKGDPGATEYAGRWNATTATIPAGAFTPAALTQDPSDPLTGGFTLAGGNAVVVPSTGWYHVAGFIQINPTTVPATIYGGLSVGGAAVAQDGNGASSGLVRATPQMVRYLTAGQSVQLVGFCSTAGGAIQQGFLAITKVGAGPAGPAGPTGPTDPVEAVHYIGAAGEPAFQGAWINNDNAAATPAGGLNRDAGFYKDRERVTLTGLIRAGASGSVAFTLPVGYRPKANVGFVIGAQGTGLTGELSIAANGNVSLTSSTGNVLTFARLDAVSFRAFG